MKVAASESNADSANSIGLDDLIEKLRQGSFVGKSRRNHKSNNRDIASTSATENADDSSVTSPRVLAENGGDIADAAQNLLDQLKADADLLSSPISPRGERRSMRKNRNTRGASQDLGRDQLPFRLSKDLNSESPSTIPLPLSPPDHDL